MRIPHIINKNTLEEYTPSGETLKLVGEDQRHIYSENFEWDKDACPSLADYCVFAIKNNFAQKPLLDELPCPDRDHLLEILSPDLPLELVLPLIDDECYWKRRYSEKFGNITRKPPPNWTWKSIYIERHVEDLIENAEPQYSDEEDMAEILRLCAPYVPRLIISQLQTWRPPLTWEKEDIPDIYPIDHISFIPILQNLPNVEEFDVVYGMNNVADKFEWNMFKLSVTDVQRLGRGLLMLKSLKILRLHRSRIEDPHVQALAQSLVKNKTLVDLDLSNCQIGDSGALCIAKLLQLHPTLQYLNISNNRIGALGAEGLGYALQETALTLKVFNIKLNPLGHDGTLFIITGVLHGGRLGNLIIAACEMEEETVIRVCNMIQIDKNLKKMDVSNNYFDDVGGDAMIESLKINRTLQWLDMRETDITKDQLAKINKLLLRNRTGCEEEEQPEELKDVIEYEGAEGGQGHAGAESAAATDTEKDSAFETVEEQDQ